MSRDKYGRQSLIGFFAKPAITIITLALVLLATPAAASTGGDGVLNCPYKSGQATLSADQWVKLAAKGKSFERSEAESISAMDDMLSKYGAKTRIPNEPDKKVREKMAYFAKLMMNGYVVSGQMAFASFTLDKDFFESPLYRQFLYMASTATEPYEGDEELASIQEKISEQRKQLGRLYEKTPYIGFSMLGAAFDDEIAVEAGARALCASDLMLADRKRIAAAIEAVRLKRNGARH